RYFFHKGSALVTFEEGDIKVESAFSSDGRYLAFYGISPTETVTLIAGILASSHKRLLLFDTQTQQTKEFTSKEGEIQGFLLLQDNQTAVVSNEKRLYLWNFVTDEKRELGGSTSNIDLLAVS